MIITKENKATTVTIFDADLTTTNDLILRLIDVDTKVEFSAFLTRLEVAGIFRFIFDF